MKNYLIGFGLVFIGFCLGFLIACVLAASGNASRMEEEIFNPPLQKVTAPGPWPGPPDTNTAEPKVEGNTFNDCRHEVSKPDPDEQRKRDTELL
jgi:hypothetical protein